MGKRFEAAERELAKQIGVRYCVALPADKGALLAARVLASEELGERSLGRGEEVIVVGTLCETELAALRSLGVEGVCISAGADAAALEQALSPATKAVWVCADAASDTVCVARNFCNAFDLWMLATVKPQEERSCLFEGKAYHVGAVADVATGSFEDVAFACTKDTLPYELMCALRGELLSSEK